ncbi:MAG: hypothetical protein KF893_11185 [Caldilineaceae bacterium]|nr:hypothetical protein [Caldilineaceae bacterium]
MRTVFGLFLDYNDAIRAVDELYRQGFKDDEIQILTEEAVAKELTGGNRQIDQGDNLVGMLAGRQGMQVSGVGSVIAVGPLTTIFTRSATQPSPAQGGLVGAFQSMGVPQDKATLYTDGINGAGIVVAMRTDADRTANAANILRRFNGREVSAYTPNSMF